MELITYGNGTAVYPHPCPLPTRGREKPSPISEVKPSKFELQSTGAKFPSPLWGGVRGGGIFTRNRLAEGGMAHRLESLNEPL
jgi:hypothetical protein